jgi:hypothetical protein
MSAKDETTKVSLCGNLENLYHLNYVYGKVTATKEIIKDERRPK